MPGVRSGRSAQVTISTPSGGSIAGASIAVRSSTSLEFRPTSRKPRRSTQARLSASSSATVVSSMTHPRSCDPVGELAVERRADAGAAVLGEDERLAVARARRRVPADVGEARRRHPRRPRRDEPGHVLGLALPVEVVVDAAATVRPDRCASASQPLELVGADLPDLDHHPKRYAPRLGRAGAEE